MLDLNSDITEIKGIGEKTAGLFHKIGVFSYDDLLYYFPRDYIRYEDCTRISEKNLGRIIAFEGRPAGRPLIKRAGKLMITGCKIVAAFENTGQKAEINAVWFNMPYISKSLKETESYVFYGIVYKKANRLCTDQPVIFTKSRFDEVCNSLQPVYSLTKGLSNNTVKKSVRNLLQLMEEKGRPGTLPENYDFSAIHFPKDEKDLMRAREAFVYDEFFMYILRLRFLRKENEKAVNSFGISKRPETDEIINGLPYSLTKAQEKVFHEVEKGLTKTVSMNRLIQGDVGCGKTIIAFLAAVMTALNGYQAALMAPTEILAGQHYEEMQKLIKKHSLPFSCVLLTGSLKGAERKKIYNDIKDGTVSIIIGTHALFQSKVIYNDLALVVTDEQHRFGVKQREAMIRKNDRNVPHVLVMSATPIPRTLAMIIYGDLDISLIDEVPARRLPVKNCSVNDTWHEKAYSFMEKELEKGHQCYVICPLVEESEGVNAKDVKSYAEILRNRFSKDINIAVLHGKMKPEEKAKVMDSFYRNETGILVSTTVVEVGVNVPNATVMLIENAERFGLAALHQLRGRIGRGDAQSYCIFMNGDDSDKNRERLNILTESNDGFYIAEKDLELRGPGELFGIRQSGDMTFRLGDIYNDSAILKKAGDDVTALLLDDPGLIKPENSRLRMKLEKLYEEEKVMSL